MNHVCPLDQRLAKLEKRDRRVARMAEVLFDTDLVGVRVTLACAEVLWAITLLWPGDTFSRDTYAIMRSMMSESLWGLLFALTAWTQWSLVIIGDFRCAFARYFAAWNALLWLTVTTTMYISVYPPPAAISGETTLALAACWIFTSPLLCKGSAS